MRSSTMAAMRSRNRVALACAVPLLIACKSEPKKEAAPQLTASARPPVASASSAPAAAGAESQGVTRVSVDAKKGDELGYALAAASDRVVATAWKRGEVDDTHPGSIFVFKREGAKLSLETELSAEKSHQMGNVVALSSDVLVAGAMFDDGTTKEAGAAYAFRLGDSGWSKATKLSDKNGKADESFGIGIAMAKSSIIVGNTRESGGSLFVFEPGKAGFQLKQTLPFPEPNGPAEALAAAGDVIAVGAQNSGKDEAGVVHVYSRGEHGFKEDQKLTESPPGEKQHFGGGVAVGPDAVAVTSEQRVSLFRKKDGKWQAAGSVTPPITTALADAGLALGEHVLVIGLPRVDEGRVLVYREQNGDWKLERTLTAPDGQKDDWFGYSLALDGKLLVIGAPLKADRAGALYTVAL
jgi:hypothetical protein